MRPVSRAPVHGHPIALTAADFDMHATEATFRWSWISGRRGVGPAERWLRRMSRLPRFWSHTFAWPR